MKNPFRRSHAIPRLALEVPEIRHVLKVEHVVRKEPEPIPVSVWLVYRNVNGMIHQSLPQRVYNKSALMASMSLGFITGRDEDIAKSVDVEIRFEYNG